MRRRNEKGWGEVASFAQGGLTRGRTWVRAGAWSKSKVCISFLIDETKLQMRHSLREMDSFWLAVYGDQVHHGEEGLVTGM